MIEYTLADLETAAQAFDAVCQVTAGIDPFCSSTTWGLAAAGGLMPARSSFIWATQAPQLASMTTSFVALMEATTADGVRYLEPLELAWGFASPLVGAERTEIYQLTSAALEANPRWRFAVIAGQPVDVDEAKRFARHLPRSRQLRAGDLTKRHHASLQDGFDGYLGRRSRTFRKNARKSLQRAREAGFHFAPAEVTPSNALQQFDRLMQVESTSWKGREDVGLSIESMTLFYRNMITRLAASGQCRLMFAQRDGADVGYVLGARFATTYRGLQFAYHDDCAKFGVGNLCQLHQIEALCREGVELYDLGSEMEYKSHWAESLLATMTWVVIR